MDKSVKIGFSFPWFNPHVATYTQCLLCQTEHFCVNTTFVKMWVEDVFICNFSTFYILKNLSIFVDTQTELCMCVCKRE